MHKRTVNESSKLGFCDWLTTIQPDLDIVAMPVGTEVRALRIYVRKRGTQTDIACTRARDNLLGI